MLNIITMLISLLFSISPYARAQSSDCFLSENTLDPRGNQQVHRFLIQAAKELQVPLHTIEQHMLCMEQAVRKNVTSPASNPQSIAQPYIDRILTSYRIKKGIEFKNKHTDILAQAEKEYSVDRHIITAIIGIESNYGAYLGKHNTLGALSAITFSNTDPARMITISSIDPISQEIIFPKISRQSFFQNELQHLLAIASQSDISLQTLTGSWDGGFGLAQFMPSSYQAYAISKKNHTPDLFDPEDAIYSIANYLSQKGLWTPGPIAIQLTPSEQISSALNNEDIIPYSDDLGLEYNDHLRKKIYKLKQGDGSFEYWLTYHNFDAIRTYNTRAYYALGVKLLADAIHE